MLTLVLVSILPLVVTRRLGSAFVELVQPRAALFVMEFWPVPTLLRSAREGLTLPRYGCIGCIALTVPFQVTYRSNSADWRRIVIVIRPGVEGGLMDHREGYLRQLVSVGLYPHHWGRGCILFSRARVVVMSSIPPPFWSLARGINIGIFGTPTLTVSSILWLWIDSRTDSPAYLFNTLPYVGVSLREKFLRHNPGSIFNIGFFYLGNIVEVFLGHHQVSWWFFLWLQG